MYVIVCVCVCISYIYICVKKFVCALVFICSESGRLRSLLVITETDHRSLPSGLQIFDGALDMT